MNRTVSLAIGVCVSLIADLNFVHGAIQFTPVSAFYQLQAGADDEVLPPGTPGVVFFNGPNPAGAAMAQTRIRVRRTDSNPGLAPIEGQVIFALWPYTAFQTNGWRNSTLGTYVRAGNVGNPTLQSTFGVGLLPRQAKVLTVTSYFDHPERFVRGAELLVLSATPRIVAKQPGSEIALEVIGESGVEPMPPTFGVIANQGGLSASTFRPAMNLVMWEGLESSEKPELSHEHNPGIRSMVLQWSVLYPNARLESSGILTTGGTPWNPLALAEVIRPPDLGDVTGLKWQVLVPENTTTNAFMRLRHETMIVPAVPDPEDRPLY